MSGKIIDNLGRSSGLIKGASAGSTTSIADSDNNTKIQTEESSDENIIRFDTAGSEAMSIDANGIIAMPLQSACSVHLSGNQTIATGTWTKLSLATELYDQNNDFDSSTNYRFTVPVDGRYLCAMNISFHLNADQECGVGIWKNGGEIHRRNGVSGISNAHYHLNAVAVADLDASDYIEFMCFHSYGSDDAITGSKEYTYCMIHKLA